MTETPQRRIRLAYLVSHPIQYQAPLLRRIAREPDIDLTVFFGSDYSVRSYKDEDFGVQVKWDVPLLEGYRSEFLPLLLDTEAVSITRPLNYGIFSRLRGKSPAERFDAFWVHGYDSVNALHGVLAAKMLGIPVLLRAEPWLKDRPRGWAKLAAKRCFFAVLRRLITVALPIGTLNTEYWRKYLGADFPLFLMPYAVDNAYFQQRSATAAATRPQLRAELNLDPSRPVILYASKLQTRKRCIDLVEAYAQLSPGGGREPHPYLLIVGDGEERTALEARARELGWESIRFLGFRNQSELPALFDLSSVFVLPSRYEPWGLIVNEVMNAARTVIVSDDVGSYPDLVEDGVTGFVFPASNVAALADALRRVFATPATASAMGLRALERIRQWSFEEDVKGLRRALAAATGQIQP